MEKTLAKSNSKVKKVFKIIGDVLFAIFFVFMLFISVVNIRAKSSNGIPNIFGTGYVTVLSDSMNGNKEDSFKAGDLIIVKIVDSNSDYVKNLEVGTTVTYYDQSEKKIISHRIIEVKGKTDNLTAYVVKGDNPLATTETTISSLEILAVYQGKWEGAGTVFAWFGSGVGFFIIVVLPCILFLIVEIINFVKTYIEYKNSKKPALEGAGDANSIQAKIKARKEAFDDLVKDGTLTREQADASLQEYINGLMKEETPVVEAKVVEDKETIVTEVNDEGNVVNEVAEPITNEIENAPVEENKVEEAAIEEAKPTEEKVEEPKPVKKTVKKTTATKKTTSTTKKATGTAKTSTTKKAPTKKSTKKEAE